MRARAFALPIAHLIKLIELLFASREWNFIVSALLAIVFDLLICILAFFWKLIQSTAEDRTNIFGQSTPRFGQQKIPKCDHQWRDLLPRRLARNSIIDSPFYSEITRYSLDADLHLTPSACTNSFAFHATLVIRWLASRSNLPSRRCELNRDKSFSYASNLISFTSVAHGEFNCVGVRGMFVFVSASRFCVLSWLRNLHKNLFGIPQAATFLRLLSQCWSCCHGRIISVLEYSWKSWPQ